MSVTPKDLALVQQLHDDIAADDRPANGSFALQLALEAVIAQATAFPGPCGECEHFDVDGPGRGFCTSSEGPHSARLMNAREGCTKFEVAS